MTATDRRGCRWTRDVSLLAYGHVGGGHLSLEFGYTVLSKGFELVEPLPHLALKLRSDGLELVEKFSDLTFLANILYTEGLNVIGFLRLEVGYLGLKSLYLVFQHREIVIL